jgi:hypothetical protein
MVLPFPEVLMFQAEVSDPTATGQKPQPKPMFVIHNWQRSYAKALLETDGEKQLAIIATAEQMILDRHFELRDYSIQTVEGLDLRHAFGALAELKKATAPAKYYPPNHHSLLIASEASRPCCI